MEPFACPQLKFLTQDVGLPVISRPFKNRKQEISLNVAGWGRNDFSNNGTYQAVMKEVDVELVDQNSCQNYLRATRLGENFVLDSKSFMCAGGEAGKGEVK